jgi:hypothetical protein
MAYIYSVLLRKSFEKTQEEIAEILSRKDHHTGETWHNFCRRRGFTMAEMLDGFEIFDRVDSDQKNQSSRFSLTL